MLSQAPSSPCSVTERNCSALERHCTHFGNFISNDLIDDEEIGIGSVISFAVKASALISNWPHAISCRKCLQPSVATYMGVTPRCWMPGASIDSFSITWKKAETTQYGTPSIIASAFVFKNRYLNKYIDASQKCSMKCTASLMVECSYFSIKISIDFTMVVWSGRISIT